MPCWWRELRAIPGVEDPWKVTWKIRASFSIPQIRGKDFLGQDYTAPPAPKCLIQNVFLPNELFYQDVWHQPLLLTVAYAWGLQFWVEKLNLPENLDFHLLARSIMELMERVGEHIMFTDQDIFWDLDGVDPEALNQWSQTSSSSLGGIEPPLDNQPGEQNICFMEATTQTASLPVTNVELAECITPPGRTEEKNWYVLVVTTSIRQLNLGTADDDLMELVAASPGRDAYQNPHMAAVFPVPMRRAISHQGMTVEELDNLMDLVQWTNPYLPLGRRVNLWPPLGRKVNRWPPLGKEKLRCQWAITTEHLFYLYAMAVVNIIYWTSCYAKSLC